MLNYFDIKKKSLILSCITKLKNYESITFDITLF